MRLRSTIPFYLILLAILAIPGWSQVPLTESEKVVIAGFQKRAEDYYTLREGIEGRLKKLPDDATPEQIEAHKVTFQKLVQDARKGSLRGDLFTSAASKIIRRLIRSEFKGFERSELRNTVLKAENKAVKLKVNVPYPASQELVEMPPQLLVTLPQLPRALRYRFVGRYLLILDRENSLIIDFMKNALP